MTSATLQALAPRSPSRVRLVFDVALSGGDYAAAGYTVTSQDGSAANPVVRAALMVMGSGNVLELALATDMVADRVYTVACVGTTSGSLPLRLGGAPAAPSPELTYDASLDVLFGRDLVWTGQDWAEGADGDLADIGGPENAKAAIDRRMGSNGLLWDSTYGLKAREHIDGAPGGAFNLRGDIVRQARADDRVRDAKATIADPTDDAPGDVQVNIDLRFVGDISDTLETSIPIAS